MKLKVLSLVTVITSLSIAATPVLAQIQSSKIAKPNLVAYNILLEEDLNLTAKQKEEIEQIRESMTSQIKSILNSEQQEQFKTLRSSGSDLRETFKQLNLSSSQRRQIKNVMRSSRQEISRVLTDEQNQILQERRQQRFSDRNKSLKGNSKQLRGVRKERRDTVRDVREERRDTVQDVREERRDTVRDVREERRDTVQDVREERRDTVRDVREERRDSVQDYFEN